MRHTRVTNDRRKHSARRIVAGKAYLIVVIEEEPLSEATGTLHVLEPQSSTTAWTSPISMSGREG